jgi:threonine/homoserine/homoserine lactone efflux protein
MECIFFAGGMAIGIIVAAPVGPVGILCVNRTLSRGRVSGFVSGLGAVTGDGFYAAVAAYGIRVITSFMSVNSMWFKLAGGFFLALVGIRIILSKADMRLSGTGPKTLAENYFSAMMITLGNPVTVVIFGTVFAAMGLGAPGTGFWDSTAMVAGIVSGSTLCWFILSGVVDALRARFKFTVLTLFNRVSGAILIGFSCIVVITAFGWLQ